MNNLNKIRLFFASFLLIISSIIVTINLILLFLEIQRKIKNEAKQTPSSIVLLSATLAIIAIIISPKNIYIYTISLAIILIDPQNWFLGYLAIKSIFNKNKPIN
ncbi:MAG: hypothetical protein HY819_05390 [Acidobacteria bacterium]|nr:hypothetical protein [Acidobacteriota bacterium]